MVSNAQLAELVAAGETRERVTCILPITDLTHALRVRLLTQIDKLSYLLLLSCLAEQLISHFQSKDVGVILMDGPKACSS